MHLSPTSKLGYLSFKMVSCGAWWALCRSVSCGGEACSSHASNGTSV